jgi:hypothetical protein
MNNIKLTAWIFSIFLALSTTQAWSFSNSKSGSYPGPIAHTATVVETMSSAGYTYIRVEEKGAKYWIALPETQVSVGEEISFYEQMLMEDFTSRSLNRTFDRILFVEAINKGKQLPTQARATPSPNKKTLEKHFEPQKTEAPGKSVGQFSIREVFDKKTELSGKVIEVKGKIVKVSQQIMGRDWVHIEDGTGTKLEKNNKLIFRTTHAGVAVDDEVVAKGVLFTNKDFGYGYYYPVIVEDTVFSK